MKVLPLSQEDYDVNAQDLCVAKCFSVDVHKEAFALTFVAMHVCEGLCHANYTLESSGGVCGGESSYPF